MAEVPILTPGVPTTPVARPILPTPSLPAPGGAAAAISGATGAVENFAKFLSIEKRKADQIAVQDGLVKASSASNEFMHGENGVLNTQGADAINTPDRFNKDWKEGMRDIELSLANETQRAAFRARIAPLEDGMQREMLKHVASEGQKQDQAVVKATVAVETEAAGRSWATAGTENDRVADAVDNVSRALAEFSLRVGMSQEELNFLVLQAESAIHVEVIESMSTAQEDIVAEEYFQAHKGQITNDDRQRLAPILKETSDRSKAVRKADEFRESGVNEQDAIDRARDEEDLRFRKLLVAEIREQYGIDREAEQKFQTDLHDEYDKLAASSDVKRADKLIPSKDFVRMKQKYIDSINRRLDPPSEDNFALLNKVKTLSASDPIALSRMSLADFTADILSHLKPTTQTIAMKLYTDAIGVARKNQESIASWKLSTAQQEIIDTELKFAGDLPFGKADPEEDQLRRKARVEELITQRVRQILVKENRPSLTIEEFRDQVKRLLVEEVELSRTKLVPTFGIPIPGTFKEQTTITPTRLVDIPRGQQSNIRVAFALVPQAKKEEYERLLESYLHKKKGEPLSERHRDMIERLFGAERIGRVDLTLDILNSKR